MVSSPNSSVEAPSPGSVEPELATPTPSGVHYFTPAFQVVEEGPFRIYTAPEPDRIDRWMQHWLVRLCWLLLSASLTFTPVPQDTEVVPPDDGMSPHPWDKKYVRQTSNTGIEVALVRRGPQGSQTWIVLQPDKELRSVRLSDRKTVLNQPPLGSYFRPLGKLTQAQKQAVKEAADQAVLSEETVPKMVRKFDGEVSPVRRLFALMSAVPALGGKTIRWITRSRYRVFGFSAIIFLAFETLQTFLIFEMLEHWANTLRFRTKEAWDQVLEVSETLKDTVEKLAEYYTILNGYVSGPRLAAWVTAVSFFLYQWYYYEGEESEDSEHSSQCSSPEETPPATPRDKASREQMMLIESLTKRQEELHEQIIQDEAKAQAREMVRKARQGESGSAWSEQDKKSFEEMARRLETFQQILEEDQKKRKKAEEGPEVPETPDPKTTGPKRTPEKKGSSEGVTEPTSTETGPVGLEQAPTPVPKKMKMDMSSHIQKLERLSQNPTGIFAQALRGLEPWEEDFVNDHFPPGYRARVAPQTFTHIYSHGKRAKEYFIEWLRSRGLMDCAAARELIACGDTLDTLLIDEPLTNFINSLQVEKLGKKIFGLQRAFENVTQSSDWKKPTGATKNWSSKVDWASAKQVDPELKMPDTLPRIREQEDETRLEMDREAMLLRTQKQLQDAAAARKES